MPNHFGILGWLQRGSWGYEELEDMYQTLQTTVHSQSHIHSYGQVNKDSSLHSSTIFRTLKAIFYQNNYNTHTLCVGLHYYEYICTHNNWIEEEEKGEYMGKICLTLSAIIHENIANTSASQKD